MLKRLWEKILKPLQTKDMSKGMTRRAFLRGTAATAAGVAFSAPVLAWAKNAGAKLKVGTKKLRNKFRKWGLTIYYQSGGWELYKQDLVDLQKFANRFEGADSVVIEGYCDPKGSVQENYLLGLKRAQTIASYLEHLDFDVDIQMISFGESKVTHKTNWQELRKTVLVVNENVITRSLQAVRSQVFLIDSSSSMAGHWGDVKYANISGTFYVFMEAAKAKKRRYRYRREDSSIVPNPIAKVDTLEDISPFGRTPLWCSIYMVLQDMKKDHSLTVLSDGDSSTNLVAVEELIKLAKKKNIIVSVIGVNLSETTKKKLLLLSNSTGGSFYMTQ